MQMYLIKIHLKVVHDTREKEALQSKEQIPKEIAKLTGIQFFFKEYI